jgi:hypothetical protein
MVVARKRGDKPIMQIVGSIFGTNVSSSPVRIVRAELRYGGLGWKRVIGVVMVARKWLENMYGLYEIPAGETRDVSFDFWVEPPTVKPTQEFIAHSVIFFDQLGNRHPVRRLGFRSTASDLRSPPKEPEEFPYQISDPIEKEVVSVLRAELGRYAMCGRTVGGLGSVHIVYQGRPFTGMGTDSWNPNSSVNQVIVSDPDAASVRSDNLEALMSFYKGFESDAQRALFVQCLLDRLEADRGYLGVSYFIVAVLWSVGSLAPALDKAKRDLPEDENRVFGLHRENRCAQGRAKQD